MRENKDAWTLMMNWGRQVGQSREELGETRGRPQTKSENLQIIHDPLVELSYGSWYSAYISMKNCPSVHSTSTSHLHLEGTPHGNIPAFRNSQPDQHHNRTAS